MNKENQIKQAEQTLKELQAQIKRKEAEKLELLRERARNGVRANAIKTAIHSLQKLGF